MKPVLESADCEISLQNVGKRSNQNIIELFQVLKVQRKRRQICRLNLAYVMVRSKYFSSVNMKHLATLKGSFINRSCK